MSTRGENTRVELLQGTLDLLILRTLVLGPVHGHAIAKAIERNSEDVLVIEQGSLYPGLHRLMKRNLVSAEDGISENKRKARFYRLTAKGRKQLTVKTTKWKRAPGRSVRFSNPTTKREAMHRRTPLDRLDQEIQDHLARETRANLDRGM